MMYKHDIVYVHNCDRKVHITCHENVTVAPEICNVVKVKQPIISTTKMLFCFVCPCMMYKADFQQNV